MPPKKPLNKKEEQKKKEKIIEDKTFGIKNKKGNKQQKFIKNVAQQVNQTGSKKSKEEPTSKKNKENQEEMRLYYNPVVDVPKVDEGVDPKTILCPFFKQGVCTKGKKCKYSHDLQEGRHKNVYVDTRVPIDEENKTGIICKYFLEAVENDLFGWRWVCPNGDNCQYRHCLPQGYVLKKDRKLMEEKEAAITIEEFIETGRANLVGTLTPVTPETFMEWKRKRLKEENEKRSEEKKQRSNKTKRGLNNGATGREVLEAKAKEEEELVEDIDVENDQVIELSEAENPEEGDDFMDVDESLFLMEGVLLDEELADWMKNWLSID